MGRIVLNLPREKRHTRFLKKQNKTKQKKTTLLELGQSLAFDLSANGVPIFNQKSVMSKVLTKPSEAEAALKL